MSLGNRRTLSFFAAESILLLCLLTLATLVFRGSIANERIRELGSWEITATIFACCTIYWTMQMLGRSQPAFWLMALLVFLAQVLAIWTHNALEWSQFFGIETGGESVRSLPQDTTIFLVSLVGLLTLYRTIGLRRLDGLLISRQVKESDRNRILLNEGLVLIGLMGSGILLAFLMVLIASSIGEHQNLLARSPFSVLTVGGSAALLLGCSLIFWLTRR